MRVAAAENTVSGEPSFEEWGPGEGSATGLMLFDAKVSQSYDPFTLIQLGGCSPNGPRYYGLTGSHRNPLKPLFCNPRSGVACL
jgi:hypothetical protein